MAGFLAEASKSPLRSFVISPIIRVGALELYYFYLSFMTVLAGFEPKIDFRPNSRTDLRPIYLLHHGDDSEVMVHPPDNDIHFMSSSEAVRAIIGWAPIAERISVIQGQLKALLEKLRKWSVEHQSLLARSDLRVRSYDDILFVVMQRDIPYDAHLSDLLSDLDIEIFNDNDFEAIRLDVLAIPRCSDDAAQAFIDLERNVRIAEFCHA